MFLTLHLARTADLDLIHRLQAIDLVFQGFPSLEMARGMTSPAGFRVGPLELWCANKILFAFKQSDLRFTVTSQTGDVIE